MVKEGVYGVHLTKEINEDHRKKKILRDRGMEKKKPIRLSSLTTTLI